MEVAWLKRMATERPIDVLLDVCKVLLSDCNGDSWESCAFVWVGFGFGFGFGFGIGIGRRIWEAPLMLVREVAMALVGE